MKQNIVRLFSLQDKLHFNEYQLLNRVGQGITSNVYKVSYENQYFALMISQYPFSQQFQILQSMKDSQYVAKIRDYFQVSKIICNTSNEHILQFGQFKINKFYILITDFIQGQTFDYKYYKTYGLVQTIKIFQSFCYAVQQLHKQNIFHCDIKPEHLIIDEDNVYLIDFSAACINPPVKKVGSYISYKITKAMEGFHSNQLFSPPKEQLYICETYDSYQLGCVLFHVLTNQYLYDKENITYQNFISQHSNKLGPHLALLLASILDKDQLYRINFSEILSSPITNQKLFQPQTCYYNKNYYIIHKFQECLILMPMSKVLFQDQNQLLYKIVQNYNDYQTTITEFLTLIQLLQFCKRKINSILSHFKIVIIKITQVDKYNWQRQITINIKTNYTRSYNQKTRQNQHRVKI
ncbi:Kinase [Hexamita inflata]|uniref:Kinase n=1 Tax=Hexamita inflata TaxID=28002 RepID=A0ABP1IZ90_9EUKA